MEHSKEYYRAFVTFSEDAINNQRRDYPYETGCKIAGDYWLAICDVLKERHIAYTDYGDVHINDFKRLRPILADCRAMVREIEKSEKDRRLDNADKWCAILFGLLGFIISIVSIILAFNAKGSI